MKRALNLKVVFLVSLILLFTFYFLLFNSALAQPTSLFSEEICDPTQPLGQPKSCDLKAFLLLIRRVIEFILWLIIPISIAFIAYGAFVIMTSRGSEEALKRGKSIITAAVIGVTIALASWLIVTAVNKILTGYIGQL